MRSSDNSVNLKGTKFPETIWGRKYKHCNELLGVQIARCRNKRNIFLFSFSIIALLMFYGPLKDLLRSSLHSDYYSHIVLIPLISGYLIYSKRKILTPKLGFSYKWGTILIVVGLSLYWFGREHEIQLKPNDYSCLVVLSAIVFWIGAFVFSCGTQAFQKAAFPLLFLVFMIPIPSVLMDKFILFLQKCSAEVTYLLFGLTGIPVAREGYVFHLPSISIEIANQCGGIRSTLALLITSILAAHLLLQTGWKKTFLVLSMFPITLLRNGVRIVTLSLLGIYVDEKILTHGFLHKSGGFIFFTPALGLLGLILFFLRKSEKKDCEQRI